MPAASLLLPSPPGRGAGGEGRLPKDSRRRPEPAPLVRYDVRGGDEVRRAAVIPLDPTLIAFRP